MTGASSKTGNAFDLGRRRDLDVAPAGQTFFDKAKALGLKAKEGTRIGPLLPKDLADLGHDPPRNQLSGLAGRPVNFRLFDSIGNALKQPSFWVP